jgi:hypothetical protein
MLLDDEWVRVPNKVIQYRSLDGDTGETRGGHWCGVTNRNGPGFEYPSHPHHPGLHLSRRFHTRCAILPDAHVRDECDQIFEERTTALLVVLKVSGGVNFMV